MKRKSDRERLRFLIENGEKKKKKNIFGRGIKIFGTHPAIYSPIREPCGNHGRAVNGETVFEGSRSGRYLSYRGRNLPSPKWLTRERINNDGGKVVAFEISLTV